MQCLVVAAAAAAFPTPPRMTDVQQTVLARLRADARLAQNQGTADALQLLSSEPFKQALQVMAPELVNVAPSELLARWDAAQEVAEITHGFPVRDDPKQNNAIDIDIDIAMNASWFYNQWQLPILFPHRERAAKFELISYLGPAADIERNWWGFPAFTADTPFRKDLWPGGFPANLDEASNRLVYAMYNQHRLDFPTFLWGDISIIFNNTEIADAVVLPPIDSGDYSSACDTNYTVPKCVMWDNETACRSLWFCRWAGDHCGFDSKAASEHNCDSWQGTVTGTFGLTHHLVRPYTNWYKGGDYVAAKRLASIVSRSVLPWSKAPNMTGDWFDFYYEANIAANPAFPQAVKFVVAWVQVLFGTDDGKRVRAWCDRWGWPLLWAQGPEAPEDPRVKPSLPRNGWRAKGRLMDAVSKHRLSNVTFSAAGQQRFNALWEDAAAVRKAGRVTAADAAQWWAKLAADPEAVAAEPLSPGSCANPGRCIGNTPTGDCICYA
eukprot:TRINITY_DN46815_c0_g1_i1.p1 TRINITY_DN46815_c0_g1~~TRINITY_DN46815_c0_g1_i1.p1  ORF type:complete len:494 (+),score=159.59 TRINITY_DN46815_c0_g1_i1:59-1540(+)